MDHSHGAVCLFFEDLKGKGFCLCDSGGLNENVPHRLIYLNVWFPVGGLLIRTKNVALLEKESLGLGSEVSKSHTWPSTSLCLLLVGQM